MARPPIRWQSLILALLLTGCGQTANSPSLPAFQADSSPLRSQDATPTAAQVIDRFGQAYNSLQDMSCTLKSLLREDEEDDDPQRITSHYFLKKPRQTRVDIKSSNVMFQTGASLAWTGGRKVQLRTSISIPFLGNVFTLDMSDKRLQSPRGLRLDQSDMAFVLERLRKPGVQATVTGSDSVDGKPVTVVTATGSWKGVDPDITREKLSFDQATGLLVRMEAMIDGQAVTTVTMSNLKVDTGLKNDLFSLDD